MGRAFELLNQARLSTPAAHYSHLAVLGAGHRLAILSGQVGILKDGSVPPELTDEAARCHHERGMMLKLDHLTVIAPSLDVGAAHVRDQLGIDMPVGGKHPLMGTHNLLLRLSSEVFLEVIAADPTAERPDRPRWFGLDDADAVRSAWDGGRRLRGWVAQTGDLDAVLTQHGSMLGQKTRLSRGDRTWLFSVPPDGSLPVDGIAPSAMDWEERGSPASAMPDLGANLLSFQIEHPDPERVAELYARLGVINPPEIRKGSQFRYRAVIDTPIGVKELN